MLQVKVDEGISGNSIPRRKNSMHTGSKTGGSVIQLQNWKKEGTSLWGSERKAGEASGTDRQALWASLGIWPLSQEQ